MGKQLEQKSMDPIAKITAPVSDFMELYERKLKEYLIAENALIYQITKHILSATGKRLRPTIVFLSASTLGYADENVTVPAIALELIHNATLLHDDVIDEAKYRRGIEAVNYRWDNLVSVLMGDYFFAKAFKILVNNGRQDLLKAVSSATERVSVGELTQVQQINNLSITEDIYLSIISDKTASLFSCAGESGAILADAGEQIRESFRGYGENLGIAFQIADDLLDYIGDEKKTGKGIASDLKEGWFTLPLIHSLKNSSQATSKEIKAILENGFREDKFELIKDFVLENGGVDYSLKKASLFRDRALDYLDKIDDSLYKEALIDLAEFTVKRER